MSIATEKSVAKYGAKFVRDFAKSIIDKHGPRLPGSEEERAAHKDIAAVMEKELGVKATVEPFKLAPIASIGAIPLLGYVGIVALIAYYFCTVASLAISALALVYAVVQIVLYKGWFDKLWPQHESNNIYSVIDGGGEIDHTIVFSGHTDSSWNWNMAVKHPLAMIPKTVYGVLGVFAVLIFSILSIRNGHLYGFYNNATKLEYVYIIAPACFLPGMAFLSNYLSYNKEKASPGAMDNLTGVGMSIFMGKYFKENPDKLPKNCRVIVAALGSEEAGLKGSFAFMKAHAGDKELLINPYFVNLDSLRDYDHFDAVKGDTWQFTRFDRDLHDMTIKAFKNAGVEPHTISNPVGGCDSTPICKKGYKTITIAAQNPIATNYYHTFNDKVEGLDMRTLEKSVDILIDISAQITEHQAKNGYKITKY